MPVSFPLSLYWEQLENSGRIKEQKARRWEQDSWGRNYACSCLEGPAEQTGDKWGNEALTKQQTHDQKHAWHPGGRIRKQIPDQTAGVLLWKKRRPVFLCFAVFLHPPLPSFLSPLVISTCYGAYRMLAESAASPSGLQINLPVFNLHPSSHRCCELVTLHMHAYRIQPQCAFCFECFSKGFFSSYYRWVSQYWFLCYSNNNMCF